MSKRLTKVLSLVLTLVMFLSVSTPAFAIGGGDMGRDFGRDIGENEIRDFEPAGEIAEEEELDYFQTTVKANGSQVTVEAPMGALPTLAELRAETVEIEDVRAAVESVVEGEANILLAMDISFWLNGIEIEPEEPVRVKISAPELEGKSNLTLIHIPDAAEPETVDLIDESDLSFALGTNEIAFQADSFSTYVITWDGDESATVHWGTMNGETFEEFDSSKIVTLDTTAATISLDVDFEGYAYLTASYKAADSENVVPVGDTLRKVEGKWQVEKSVSDENGTTTHEWVDLGNGDEIYAIYVVPQSQPSSGAEDENVPSPVTEKNVNVNDDGTRTIVLDVTGTTVKETDEVGANVLILIDRTTSMETSMSDGGTRFDAAKAAVDTLIGVLTGGENPGVVNYALLDFYLSTAESDLHTVGSGWSSYYVGTNRDRLHSWANNGAHQNSGTNYWTTNASTFNAYIQDRSYTYGGNSFTNWESPLVNALTILNARNTNNKTYVIFVTDGGSNAYNYSSNTSYGIFNHSYSNFNANTMTTRNTAAVKGITSLSNVELYGVFCGDSDGYSLLNRTIMNNGGKQVINGSDANAMKTAFGDIAHTIVEEMGASNVSVDDGVPSLSSVSSGVVEGGAGGYEYFRLYPLTASGSNYTYKIGETSYTVTAAQVNAGKDADGNVIEQKDGTYYIEIPWTEGYPGASYNQANGVTWDLSTVPVQPGVTYRLKFKVWPSQEAYDTIADLNNGLITMTQEELDAAGIGGNKEDGYYLLTNTHLKTTYSFNGVTYEDEPSETPTSEMILPTTTIKITKIWNNELDAREASDVRLEVTKDGEPYLYDDEDAGIATAIEMTDAVKTGPHQWTQTNDSDIYISMGQLTRSATKNDDDTYDIEVISSGHDYTVVEPENFSYRWDLTADIYHPMVINGEPVVLIEVTKEAKAELPDAVKNLAQNKHYYDEASGKDYYAFNKELYVAQTGSNVLTAINDRRSNLIINKVVEETNAPADDVFAIKVTLDNPNDPHPGEEGYSDWYHTMWFYVSTEENNRDTIVILEDDQVEGATREEGGNPEGYWFFDNGGTVTVYLKAGQYLNFNNMGRGTNYTIEELDGEKMPEGYIFDKAETAADNKVQGETSTPGTVDTENPRKVTGTIDKPNTDYSVTYTNKYLGVFYVYHSSDLSVERFPMAVNGVAYKAASGDEPAVTFDVFALKKDGTLYGGYYSDYAGKSENFDAAALDFSGEDDPKDEGGQAYTYAAIKGDDTTPAIVWDWEKAYKVKGTEMIPEAGLVYYLKEVPTGYMMPYTHYSYFKDESKALGNVWAISATDDLNYQEVGFVVIEENMKATMLKSMTINTVHGGTSVTLTPNKVFKAKGVLEGYLGYVDISSFKANNAKIMIRQYWVSPDGIYDFGITMRELSFGDCTILSTGIKKTDMPFEPLS